MYTAKWEERFLKLSIRWSAWKHNAGSVTMHTGTKYLNGKQGRACVFIVGRDANGPDMPLGSGRMDDALSSAENEFERLKREQRDALERELETVRPTEDGQP